MPIDTEALFAEAKALGIYEERKPRKKAITLRRYNVTVDGETIAQYVTSTEANNIRNEYRGKAKQIVIEETLTHDSNGKDISKLPPPALPQTRSNSVAHIKGIQNFATPTLTERRAETLRARKSKKSNPKVLVTQRTIENPWRDKKDPLHEEYMEAVERNGYIVTNQYGTLLYWGQKKEVVAYLSEYMGDITQIKATRITKKIRKQYGL